MLVHLRRLLERVEHRDPEASRVFHVPRHQDEVVHQPDGDEAFVVHVLVLLGQQLRPSFPDLVSIGRMRPA